MTHDHNESRSAYLASKRGDLTSYASMIGDEFSTRVDQLAQIIGTSHEPSVGTYKESLLRSVIAKFIPKRYSVATGFVVFTRRSSLNDMNSDNIDLLNLKEHYVSKQLDIIVYDDYNFAPILKDGDFVVLRPEAVRSIIEVKGYISKKGLSESVAAFIDFGRKWIEYKSYRSQNGGEQIHFPALQLMAWNVHISPKGKSDCDGKIMRKLIVSSYRAGLAPAELSDRTFPLLSSAYLYNNCIVSRCGYAQGKRSGDGYFTNRGQFVRYNANKVPSLAGDCTIASLLACVHLSLETPFNSDFSYLDQTLSTNLFAHQHRGITDLHSGEEINIDAKP